MTTQRVTCRACGEQVFGWELGPGEAICYECYERREAREILARELAAKDAEIERLRELAVALEQRCAASAEQLGQVRLFLLRDEPCPACRYWTGSHWHDCWVPAFLEATAPDGGSQEH